MLWGVLEDDRNRVSNPMVPSHPASRAASTPGWQHSLTPYGVMLPKRRVLITLTIPSVTRMYKIATHTTRQGYGHVGVIGLQPLAYSRLTESKKIAIGGHLTTAVNTVYRKPAKWVTAAVAGKSHEQLATDRTSHCHEKI